MIQSQLLCTVSPIFEGVVPFLCHTRLTEAAGTKASFQLPNQKLVVRQNISVTAGDEITRFFKYILEFIR